MLSVLFPVITVLLESSWNKALFFILLFGLHSRTPTGRFLTYTYVSPQRSNGVVLRSSRSLNSAVVAQSLATSLLRPIGGTTLGALDPGVPVNFGTDRPPQARVREILGREEARWDFGCCAR
ncbi:hypothetical protein AVEN_62810-1 [Araneus ventricosus]|uniref:Uncharacterized protein n=1 Tax=Araneus ventricosus TaxID=182803 RepID=A0A4Y2IDJ0_ARAVE|nr:hypothetical protein AVEN_62810-1 [Araneus ventricosus]